LHWQNILFTGTRVGISSRGDLRFDTGCDAISFGGTSTWVVALHFVGGSGRLLADEE